MGLQAILDGITSAGEARLHEIEARTCQTSDEILAKARLEAEQIQAEVCASVAAPALRERARIIHKAHLTAIQIIGEARDELVNTALQRTRTSLERLRMDPIYPVLLQKLTLEALSEIESSVSGDLPARLEADPRDRLLLEGTLKKVGVNLPVDYKQECCGGLIARSGDQRVIAYNTLEARYNRAIPYLRRFLAALFEARQGTGSEVCPTTTTETPA